MKLTIDELVEKVNELISKKTTGENIISKDLRVSNSLSVRRIRDYMTKGLLHKPFGKKDKWFDESHVETLLILRELQSSGLSENYILKSTEGDFNEKNDALDFLDSINKKNEDLNKNRSSKINNLVGQTYYGNMKNLVESTKLYTQFNEYCVDKEMGVFLKVNSKIENSIQVGLVDKLKNEIKNFKEKKYD